MLWARKMRAVRQLLDTSQELSDQAEDLLTLARECRERAGLILDTLEKITQEDTDESGLQPDSSEDEAH